MTIEHAVKKQTDKKNAILDSALALFVSQGFHATSTASIAKAAGVATGTLFHHFPSKDSIINHLFLNIKQEFANTITSNSQVIGDIELDANALWQSAIDWAIAQPLKQKFFLQFSLSAEINAATRQQAMNGILRFIVELIEKGQQQNIVAHYPIDLLLENCHGQYLAAIRFFTDHPELGKDASHRHASFQLFWKAIKA
ncbi:MULTISPECIES: TetR/AcrR family transcriptional regulator [Pseudomonadati]|uniref:TetR/AcrR family transcriptional regulator n=1 Tax=Shewanella aestuarii TaxID=1028752 RepID=A0ABT0L0G6_9GAMM|nr:TetR/AcrR family transcriptional regulator [Shewanella aestuarii]MCL1117209.1 TetR/AcrR family transcriptional regulator [Shewanella aestuarii]GGN74137.1 TetR family transcriptional regulator [Shewanella aestuarii]